MQSPRLGGGNIRDNNSIYVHMLPPDCRLHRTHAGRRRQTLAVVRLALLYGLLCALIVASALLWQHALEADWRLRPADASAPALTAGGVTIDLLSQDFGSTQQQLADLEEAGFTWLRQRFAWDKLEPNPGRPTWQASDDLLAALSDTRLETVALLDGSPIWARAEQDRRPIDNRLAPPADPADFARFAGAFAARYGGQIRYYQIWHEPNIAPHWGARHIDPVAYTQLLHAASAAIRAADADAVIIGAALAPTADRGHEALDEVFFLQRMFAAGAREAVDVIAIEPYGMGHAPEDPAQRRGVLNLARAAWIRRALQAAGHADIPLWATSYGWNRQPNAVWGAVSSDDQIGYARRAIEQSQARWLWLTAMAWPAALPVNPAGNGFSLTPTLSAAITQAAAEVKATDTSARRSPAASSVGLAALGTVLVVLFWRGIAAIHMLPWMAWRNAWRRTHWTSQLVAWATLGLLYHFAVWPPLIGLCWIGALLLTSAQPRVGLGLALMLLPFYYQHKETALVNQVISVSPAYVPLVSLLPAISVRLVNPGGNEPAVATRSRKAEFPLWYLRHTVVGKSIRLHPLDGVAALWFIISLLSAWNVWHWPAYRHALLDLTIMPLLLYLALRVLVERRNEWLGAAGALAGGGVLVAVLGLGGWFRGMGTEADHLLRLVGPHFSPNHTALYLERTLFVLAGLAWISRRRRRWLTMLAFGSTLLALLLTASRGAWLLGIPAGTIAFALLMATGCGSSRGRTTGSHGWTITALVVGVIVTLSAIAVFGWERLTNQATVIDRLAIWRSSAALWRDHLWVGVGPGGFYWRYPAYIPTGAAMDPNLRHPHNLWLELGGMWGMMGIGWLLAATTILIISLHRLWRTWPGAPAAWRMCQPVAAGLIAGLIASIAHGQVDAFGVLADLASWNWAAMGLLVALLVRVDQSTPQRSEGAQSKQVSPGLAYCNEPPSKRSRTSP